LPTIAPPTDRRRLRYYLNAGARAATDMGVLNADARARVGRVRRLILTVARGSLIALGVGAFAAPHSSGASQGTSALIGEPGAPCGVVRAVFAPQDAAIATRVVVENGEFACADARVIVRDFLSSGPYQTSAGRYHRDVGDWQCLTQTAGFHPEVVHCDHGGEGLRVLGLDVPATLAAETAKECDTLPDADSRAPFNVRANIPCRTAVEIARGETAFGFGRLGPCGRRHRCSGFAFGFDCEFRAVGSRGSEATCRLGNALVEFALPQRLRALPFTGRNEIALAAMGVLMLIIGLGSRAAIHRLS
jgi:hypothetical protein